ncbi:ABC transporter ATP-binding protein [Streptacidiphilus sp. ASG 303]|uniref:ABC transporter ATP-binding protein n=1 Tax=Streptacidiphilus sp. ASG 303 TaxID=2896847 RepID=UPI001E48A41E|nr:ABC transporter ATP-binding protein [Streptacidiphilus sp. ASG 303]MCD0485254.1 ABC transporter ATP-binding protein [Streptacidiphilus sp. ASG 303]
MMNTVAVRAEALTVVRGGRTVLDGLGFTVPRSTVTGLLGPSGCGKTTLMRVLAGVQANATGTAEVLGLPAGDPGLRHRVGYVTQAPSVYADLSVRENLAYYAAVLAPGRARRAARAEAVDRVLAEVDLAGYAGTLASRLSGGQRSRVSLAVALLGAGTGDRPELLVLDEPTVGLDPVLRRDLWALFHRLAADGAAVLVSSHVMDEAERCDRLLLLREGRLLAEDTPDALRARTGAATVEDAFLRLVEAPAGPEGPAGPGGTGGTAAPGGAGTPSARHPREVRP